MFWWTLLLQISFYMCVCLQDFIKIVRLLLADVSINGLTQYMLTAAKKGWTNYLADISSKKSLFQKIFEGEMSIRTLSTILLEIYFEFTLNLWDIFKNDTVADDIINSRSSLGMNGLKRAWLFDDVIQWNVLKSIPRRNVNQNLTNNSPSNAFLMKANDFPVRISEGTF